jgi:hypothetical protein
MNKHVYWKYLIQQVKVRQREVWWVGISKKAWQFYLCRQCARRPKEAQEGFGGIHFFPFSSRLQLSLAISNEKGSTIY